jgi:hypothetical protein
LRKQSVFGVEVNVSEADDTELVNYLHRKSALSMGYKKVYVEAPPAELDRAIKARARRALKFLGPAMLSALIALGTFTGLIVGVGKFMDMAVQADRHKRELENPPVAVDLILETPVITLDKRATPSKLTREQWQEKIETLKAAGKNAEAEAELRRFKEVYPN